MTGITTVGTQVRDKVDMSDTRRTHPYNLLIALAGWVVVVYQVTGLIAAFVSFLSAAVLQAGISQASDMPARFRRFVRILQFSLPLMLVYSLIQAALSLDGSDGGNTPSSSGGASELGSVLWLGPTVPMLGHLVITTGSLLGGVDRALRLWALLLGIMAITRMIQPDDVTVWLGRHFARVSLTISMMMNFLPLMQAEYRRINEFVWSRTGIGTPTNWRLRLRVTGAVLQALLMNALDRSWSLAESMFVRGYGNRARSFYQPTAWRSRDIGVLVVWVLLGSVAVTVKLLNPGTDQLAATQSVTPLAAQLGFSIDVCAASVICLWLGGMFRANRGRS